MQPRNALVLDALHCHAELDSLWFVCDSSRQQTMTICMFWSQGWWIQYGPGVHIFRFFSSCHTRTSLPHIAYGWLKRKACSTGTAPISQHQPHGTETSCLDMLEVGLEDVFVTRVSHLLAAGCKWFWTSYMLPAAKLPPKNVTRVGCLISVALSSNTSIWWMNNHEGFWWLRLFKWF